MSLGSNKSLVLHVLFLVLTSCSDGGMRLELGILTYTNAPDRMAWVVTSINPIYAFHLALVSMSSLWNSSLGQKCSNTSPRAN